MAATELLFEESEFVNVEHLEFFIQIILSVTKITEEDGCSLPCQWGHPGHEDAHPGQHCAAPPHDLCLKIAFMAPLSPKFPVIRIPSSVLGKS